MYPKVVVCCSDPRRRPEAVALADTLGLGYTDDQPAAAGRLALVMTPTRLELRDCSPRAPGPVFVDLVTGPVGRRGRGGAVRDEALARAAGLRGGERPRVIDATAGLGRDAFVLAARGCRVLAVERHPVVVALLADGLARAADDPATAATVRRIELVAADAMQVLATRGLADVVLVDPMHPVRPGSPAVRKEMRLFRALVGTDEDAGELLAAALPVARRRVVVKRPRNAPGLPGPPPSGTVVGRSTRFDIYAGRG